TLVRPAPVGAKPVYQPHECGPAVVPDGRAVLVVQIDGVHQLSVDIELQVVEGGVPYSDRTGPHVALEVGQHRLGQCVTAVEPVHDLKRAVGLQLTAARHHPAHESGRLLRVAEAHQ